MEILPGLFQPSLLGDLSLDLRCFIALNVSHAMEPHTLTLAEALDLVLELAEKCVL